MCTTSSSKLEVIKTGGGSRKNERQHWDLGLNVFGLGKLKGTLYFKDSRAAKMKPWLKRLVTTLLIWTCVIQFVGRGEEGWGPKLLKGWPSCQSFSEGRTVANATTTTTSIVPRPRKVHFPPKRMYTNNGYLIVSCNGGLNQMRAAICDMVAIARHLNVTLIVPELDKTSFWRDPSDFQDIFNVNHFIMSLRDEVRILRELPPRLKKKVEARNFYELPPVSWSNISYYHEQILPLLKKHKVVHLNKTDARLANNGLPVDIQKLRCKVNYRSLRFTAHIEELGRKVVRMLRKNGLFLVLHLRYEMDMLSFSGCTQGLNAEEVDELTAMRYANPWWKEKLIDPDMKRKEGLCPFTPEETALILTALGIDRNIQIYIAAGEIYGGKRRLKSLASAFPNMVKKETLLEPSDLWFIRNHSSQMAALDYLVSLESDVFVPTYDGNMAKVVEGHRRHLGFKKTIQLDKRALVGLIDRFNGGSMGWDEFSSNVKELHSDRMGRPKKRVIISDKPKEEDYFYANPEECLAFSE